MRYISIALFCFTQSAFADSLFSLTVGAKWIYELEGGTSKTITNSIKEVRTVDGKDWYRLSEYGETFWVRNTEQGQVEAVNFVNQDPDQLNNPEEILVFKYPAEVGETWPNMGSPTTYKGIQTYTVPAGTFDCHEYYIDLGEGYYSRSCIAIDIGVVYNVAVLDGGKKEVSKLIRYE
ncbi:hypothetical protein [Nitrincola sp.]|uniref:hypothetical protein n=1 Tax=Nitrincola sp. TaxID=1926584 RepID=UPI003A9228B6